VSEAHYVQVTADALDYLGRQGTASYVGNVRLRQAEGTLQSGRLEAALDEAGGLRTGLASEEVSFEYRQRGEDGKPHLVRGKGDRAEYLPRDNLVRLFGDRAPARVSREGPESGTTEGRVLRYALDSGVLEVESGARDRGRIETSGT
jgi:lipopolysaccharide transport protein LptA